MLRISGKVKNKEIVFNFFPTHLISNLSKFVQMLPFPALKSRDYGFSAEWWNYATVQKKDSGYIMIAC